MQTLYQRKILERRKNLPLRREADRAEGERQRFVVSENTRFWLMGAFLGFLILTAWVN